MITNPTNVFGQTDEAVNLWHVSAPFKNTGAVAIVKGDVVAFSYDETNSILGVLQQDAGVSDPALIAGVAQEGFGVSEVGMVVIAGYAEVNITTGSVAAAERAIPHASTDGAADGVAADATTVAGDTFGVFLGDEIGTTNTAPVWVGKA